MKKVRVLVNGAGGKMGSASVKAIDADESLLLVAKSDRYDDLADIINGSNPDVVLDFTNAESAMNNARVIIKSGKVPVIGTSGFTKTDVTELKELAESNNVGGIIVPNFALGAVLMMKCASIAARYIPNVEIIETHHENKLDAPSGTAVRTAEMINSSRLSGADIKKNVSKELVPGARGAEYDEVRIHSVRLPGHVAHQQVIFGGTGEILTIRHDSLNRDSFMPGVCLACKKAVELNSLMYGLEHLL